MKKFPTARLLFTDTDSLCYHIETEKDLYDEIKVLLSVNKKKLSKTFILGFTMDGLFQLS